MTQTELVEVVPPVTTEATVRGLVKLAKQLSDSYATTVEKYFELCCFVRDQQITPEVLTLTLREEGFADSRISEIKKVSFSTKEIFEEYRSKAIGFKLALKKAREEKKAEKVEQADLAEIEEEEEKETEPTVEPEVRFEEAVGRAIGEYTKGCRGKYPGRVFRFCCAGGPLVAGAFIEGKAWVVQFVEENAAANKKAKKTKSKK